MMHHHVLENYHNYYFSRKWGHCKMDKLQAETRESPNDIFQYLDKHPEILKEYLKKRPGLCSRLGIR